MENIIVKITQTTKKQRKYVWDLFISNTLHEEIINVTRKEKFNLK